MLNTKIPMNSDPLKKEVDRLATQLHALPKSEIGNPDSARSNELIDKIQQLNYMIRGTKPRIGKPTFTKTYK